MRLALWPTKWRTLKPTVRAKYEHEIQSDLKDAKRELWEKLEPYIQEEIEQAETDLRAEYAN